MKRAADSSKRLLMVLIIAVAVIAMLIVGIKAIWRKPDASTSSGKTPAVVVAIDPAHGGSDVGSSAEGALEKDITLAVATKMSAMAREFPKLRIVLARSTDADVSAEERVAVASTEAAQLFVAIHVNAFGQPTALGIETLVDSTHTSGDASWTFATAVQKGVVLSTGAKDRGVRAQGSSFARLVIPAASVLIGFVTTPEERAKLVDPAYQELVARGILQGIANYVAAAGVTPASSTQTVPLEKGQTAKPAGSTPP
jgi:N-acetylmuramoyl-L-alanine amidase